MNDPTDRQLDPAHLGAIIREQERLEERQQRRQQAVDGLRSLAGDSQLPRPLREALQAKYARNTGTTDSSEQADQTDETKES